MIRYQHPKSLNGPNFFGGNIPSLDRLRTLLILSGHGDLHCNGKKIKLNKDFITIPHITPGRFGLAKITQKIPGCTNYNFISYIKKAATKNINIHKNVYNETLHCIYHYETKRFLSSFVYLYRLVEHTALYLPLVAVVSKGVNGLTFNDYKEVIENKAKADLSVLKKFSNNILDANVRSSNALFDFSTTSHPQKNLTTAIKLLDSSLIVSRGSERFELQYQSVDRLIINFRNQFFHYLYHERNISLDELDNPDEFLSICMPIFINYFSFLYRELIIAEWELWS